MPGWLVRFVSLSMSGAMISPGVRAASGATLQQVSGVPVDANLSSYHFSAWFCTSPFESLRDLSSPSTILAAV